MRRILTSLVLVASAYSFAQVGISGNTSDTPRATLDVRAIGGATADGILIPKVNKDRAQSMPTPEDSTLAYIENNGTGGDKTVDVDADGFYYFKGDKWIKLGGGATANPFLGNTKGNIRVLGDSERMTAQTWKKDDFALVVRYISSEQGENPELPDPTGENKNRIIVVINTVGETVTFGGSSPIPNSSMRKNSGAMYISNGKNWYQLASF